MATLPPEVVANIAAKRLGIDQQKQRGIQDLGNQYNTNLSNLTDYDKDAQQRINDQFGAQGIADSGIRVNEQGRLQKNVGQKRSMLGQQYAQGQSGIQTQWENAIQALNDYQTEQMTGQTRQDLATQLQQQQIAATNAQTQAAMSASQGGGGGGGGQAAGPSIEALNAWYAEAARQEQAAIDLWNATIAQNQSLKTYRGGVGRVM